MEHGYTALLLEDDAFIAGLALEHLKQYFQVTHAETIQSAEQALTSARFDVIFADVMLPDGDGIEFVERYISGAPEHPALITMLTNLGDEDTLARARAAGASLFYVKSTANYREIADEVIAELENRGC